jgi:hypothetical protein
MATPRKAGAEVRLAVLFGFFREPLIVDIGNQRVFHATEFLIGTTELETLPVFLRRIEIRTLGVVDIDNLVQFHASGFQDFHELSLSTWDSSSFVAPDGKYWRWS